MKKSTVKSFIKSIIAHLEGDNSEIIGQKIFRQAQSALQTQISMLQGDLIGKEDAVTAAEENLEKKRINHGGLIKDRTLYSDALLQAFNNLTKAQEDLEDHKAKLDFFKTELILMDKEETEG